VLGVAGLVAILAKVSPADPLPAFRGSLVLVIAFFAAAGVVSAVLLTRRPNRALVGPMRPPGRQTRSSSAAAPAWSGAKMTPRS
jgi:hypothetical protein